jgi:hypothetical protein
VTQDYQDKLWKHVPSFAIPSFIFRDGSLQLNPSELAVYVCICQNASRPNSNCEFTISVDELVKLTSYSDRQVIEALSGLREKQFIRAVETGSRNVSGQFVADSHVMCNPKQAGRSMAQPTKEDRREHVSLRSLLFAVENESYFSAPEHVVSLMEKLKGSPLSVYVAVLQIAKLMNETEFDATLREVRILSSVSRNEILFKAVHILERERTMDVVTSRNDRNSISVTLKNPATGRDMEDDAVDESLKRQWAASPYRPYTREQLLKWAASVFRVPVNIGDEWTTRHGCAESKTRKLRYRNTLSMNGDKGKHGVYYCHACEEGGTLLELVCKHGHMGVISALALLERIAEQ